MRVNELIDGLKFIVARVGDGYYLAAEHDILYINVERERFSEEERYLLSDKFSIHSGLGEGDDNPGGFYAFV